MPFAHVHDNGPEGHWWPSWGHTWEIDVGNGEVVVADSYRAGGFGVEARRDGELVGSAPCDSGWKILTKNGKPVDAQE